MPQSTPQKMWLISVWRAMPHGVAVLLVMALGWLAGYFTVNPHPASFSDDSANYLAMAEVFSPWAEASARAQQLLATEPYPPAFPLLLAVLGAAQDIEQAHWIVVGCFLAATTLLYLLYRRWLGDGWPGVIALLLWALLPTVWLNLQGILSEQLYLLCSLALLYQVEQNTSRQRWNFPQLLLATLLLVGMVWSRPVGLAMPLAWLLLLGWQVKQRQTHWTRLLPPIAAIVALLGWMRIFPGTQYGHAHLIDLIAQQYAQEGMWPLLKVILSNGTAMASAWLNSWMIYWVEAEWPRWLLFGLWGGATLWVLMVRVWHLKLDAWYIAIYLGILLIWPAPEEMLRFLYPLMPLLLIYPVLLLRQHPWQNYLLVLLMVLVMPASAFIINRYGYQEAGALTPFRFITEFYRYPNLEEAHFKAMLTHQSLADMKRIQQTTEPDAKVLWVKPNFINALAQRDSALTPVLNHPDFITQIQATQADYIYLSWITARGNADGLRPLPILLDFCTLVWINPIQGTTTPASALLRIK